MQGGDLGKLESTESEDTLPETVVGLSRTEAGGC